jgi:hypothetical protein
MYVLTLPSSPSACPLKGKQSRETTLFVPLRPHRRKNMSHGQFASQFTKLEDKVKKWAASNDPSVDSKVRRSLWREFQDIKYGLASEKDESVVYVSASVVTYRWLQKLLKGCKICYQYPKEKQKSVFSQWCG